MLSPQVSGVTKSVCTTEAFVLPPPVSQDESLNTFEVEWSLSPTFHAEITTILASSVLEGVTRLILESTTAKDVSLP